MKPTTRLILGTVAVAMAGLLLLRASSGAANESSASVISIAADPAPSIPHELLQPYTASGYRQGLRQTIEVVTLGTSPVELTTARAFIEMRDAAALAEISLSIESGFRTHAEQKVLYSAWRRGKGNRAARPGESNHQSGRALDISVKDPATYAWLSANADRFGFKRTVASEPWHWEYVNTPRARSATTAKKAKKAKTSSGRASRPRSRRVAR